MKYLAFLLSVLGVFSVAQAATFIDEADFPTWAEDAIESVKEHKIMTGFGDGSFRPNQNLTRAEAVTLLLRAKTDITNNYNGVPRFPDVQDGAWYEDAVGVAASNSWVLGRPDGYFYPADNLTRAEFVTIVARAFDLKPEGETEMEFEDVTLDQWFGPSVEALYEHDLLRNGKNRYYRPEQIVDRAEAAWMFAQIMSKPGVNGSAADVSYEGTGYTDSRRVAIKPKNFDPNDQGFDIERSAIHVDVSLPEDEVVITNESDWQRLGNVRFRNTLEYRADVESIQFYLRFPQSGVGPANAFELRFEGAGLEKESGFYRNGEVTFTGLDMQIDPAEERVIEVWVKKDPEVSAFPREAVGTVYVKDVTGEGFRLNEFQSTEVTTAPVEFDARNLRDFVYQP